MIEFVYKWYFNLRTRYNYRVFWWANSSPRNGPLRSTNEWKWTKYGNLDSMLEIYDNNTRKEDFVQVKLNIRRRSLIFNVWCLFICLIIRLCGYMCASLISIRAWQFCITIVNCNSPKLSHNSAKKLGLNV